MTLFPPWFLTFLVYGGIAGVAVGVCVLLVLLVRDIRGKRLW